MGIESDYNTMTKKGIFSRDFALNIFNMLCSLLGEVGKYIQQLWGGFETPTQKPELYSRLVTLNPFRI